MLPFGIGMLLYADELSWDFNVELGEPLEDEFDSSSSEFG